MHGTGRIEVSVTRLRCHDHASVGDFGYIVAQRARDGIERQRSLDKAVDELEAAHLLAPIGGNGPIGLLAIPFGIVFSWFDEKQAPSLVSAAQRGSRDPDLIPQRVARLSQRVRPKWPAR